jgi:hypothetical protein
MFNQDTAHVARGVGRLIEQWKNKKNITALTRIFLLEVQALEDAIAGVYNGRLLANAVGVQLDTIGRYVGEPRKGRADGVYVLWLKARIAANRSFGRAQDLIKVIKILTAHTFRFIDLGFPCAFLLQFDDAEIYTDAETIKNYGYILASARAAGVNGQTIFPSRTVTEPTAITPMIMSHAGDTDIVSNSLGSAAGTIGATTYALLSHVRQT